MNDEIEDLERELRQFKPRAPGPSTTSAIATELANDRSRGHAIGRGWLVLPVAVAVALAFLWYREPGAAESQASSKTTAMFKPVGAVNVLLSSQDEGYVMLADGTTGRRIRQTYLATFTWKNPRTHASLSWTVPREDVSVLPVRYQ